MRFIYILMVFFFIGCQSQLPIPPIPSTDKTDKTDKIDERLKAYKATYDGHMAYKKGYFPGNVSPTKKAIFLVDSIKYFKKALKLQEYDAIYGERKNPVINIDKGFGFGKTISGYGQSTANTQLNYYLYLTMGKSYYSLCRMDKNGNNDYCQDAIDNFNEAINILEENGYNYPDPYYHKGMAYMVHNHISDARNSFKRAIIVHNKGKKYFEDRIIVEYIKELSSSEYKKYIKNIKYKIKKKKEIKEKIKEELSSSEARVHIALSVAYSDLFIGRSSNKFKLNNNTKKWLKEIKKEYLKVLRIDPEHDTAFHNLGETEYILKNYENAIGEINKALFINPTDAASYIIKGSSLLKLEEEDLACFNFSIAETLDEKYEIQEKEIYEKLKKKAKCF